MVIETPPQVGLNAPLNNILVLPADLVAETADSAVLAAGLQAQDTQSLGNDHLLLLVVGGRDTLEDLEALKGSSTTGGLVGNHAADGLVEDARRSPEVEGTSTGGVVSGHLAQVGVVLDCIQIVSFPLYLISCRPHEIPSRMQDSTRLSVSRWNIYKIDDEGVGTYASHGRTLRRCSGPRSGRRRSSGR